MPVRDQEASVYTEVDKEGHEGQKQKYNEEKIQGEQDREAQGAEDVFYFPKCFFHGQTFLTAR